MKSKSKNVSVSHSEMDHRTRSWQSFFVVLEKWQSDLAFYGDEIRFLQKLIDRYFMWLNEDNNVERTRLTTIRLGTIESRRIKLNVAFLNHRRQLYQYVVSPFANDFYEITEEHERLEVAMSEITRDFRLMKKQIFILTEHVLETERSDHFLH